MFKEMRRQDRQVDLNEAEDIITRGSYGVLSLNGTNGYAYGVPLNYVYLNNSIYFHCATEGQKLDLLKANPLVSFCVVNQAEVIPDKFSTRYQSAIVFGKATEVDGDEKIAALLAFIDKYVPDPEHIVKGKEYVANAHHQTKIVRLDIDQLTGKSRK